VLAMAELVNRAESLVRPATRASQMSIPTGMSLDERLAVSSMSNDGGSISFPLPERPDQLSEAQLSKIRSEMAHAICSKKQHGPYIGDRSTSTSCYLPSSRSSRSG
jgi:hypothetical protein